MKGHYMLIDQQVNKLHTQIVIRCNQSHSMKRKVRMLSNSDDLQLYLQLAFDHFSNDLDRPFNFIEMALRVNPIPSYFGGNITKLAVAIRDYHPEAIVSEVFTDLSLMVAFCIMLDIYRHRLLGQSFVHLIAYSYHCYFTLQRDSYLQKSLGTPTQLLEDYYMTFYEQAFSDFCDRHWPCSFRKKKERCANVNFGHASKGHQNQRGESTRSRRLHCVLSLQ